MRGPLACGAPFDRLGLEKKAGVAIVKHGSAV